MVSIKLMTKLGLKKIRGGLDLCPKVYWSGLWVYPMIAIKVNYICGGNSSYFNGDFKMIVVMVGRY